MSFRRNKRSLETTSAATTANLSDEDSSDSDSDEEFNSEEVQQAGPRFDTSAIMQSAQVGRIKANTRSGYEGQLRQLARWAQFIDEFKHCVLADGKMVTPLEEACMVAYTEHLKTRQVNWPASPRARNKKTFSSQDHQSLVCRSEGHVCFSWKTIPQQC